MDSVLHDRHPGTPGVIARLYLLLLPVPVVCFVAAIATDAAYSASAYLMWLHFSEWLIAVGLAFGALAGLTLLVEFIASRTVRAASGWVHLVLVAVMLAVELWNSLVHTIDGYTAVVPTGMALSVIGGLLALAAVVVLFRTPLARPQWQEARS